MSAAQDAGIGRKVRLVSAADSSLMISIVSLPQMERSAATTHRVFGMREVDIMGVTGTRKITWLAGDGDTADGIIAR